MSIRRVKPEVKPTATAKQRYILVAIFDHVKEHTSYTWDEARKIFGTRLMGSIYSDGFIFLFDDRIYLTDAGIDVIFP